MTIEDVAEQATTVSIRMPRDLYVWLESLQGAHFERTHLKVPLSSLVKAVLERAKADGFELVAGVPDHRRRKGRATK